MRLFSVLFSAVVLSACQGSQQDLAGFLDRNPAMRTLSFGYAYDLAAPSGFTTARGQTSNGDYAFLNGGGWTCPSVAIYALADAEVGIREPRQVLRSCEEEGLTADDDAMRAHLAASEGMLLAGANVFVETASGFVLEAVLPVRPDLEILGNAIVSEDQVAVLTETTVHFFDRSDEGWFESTRVGFQGRATLFVDGDFLAAGSQVFHRDGDEWTAVYDAGEHRVVGLANERALVTRDFTNIRGTRHYQWDLVQWDGTGFERTMTTRRSPESTTPGLSDAFVLTMERQVLTLVDDAGTSLFSETVKDDWGQYKTVASGDQALVAKYDQRSNVVVHWLQLLGHDPVAGQVGELSASIAREEWARTTFEVPQGGNTLTVLMSGSGDADLYVKKDGEPALRDFDCSPYRAGSDEVCVFDAPEPGTWHLGVHGFEAQSEVSVVATID